MLLMEATQFAMINLSYGASTKLIESLAIVVIVVSALSLARSLLHVDLLPGDTSESEYAMYHTYLGG